MKERFAIVSFKLPLRTDYPWKVVQGPIETEVGNAVSDSVRHLECTLQGERFDVTVKVVNRESTRGQ